MPLLTKFRALSGSQYVYYTSDDAEPAGVTNRVVLGQDVVPESGGVSSKILWQWNKTDTTQFGGFHNFESDLGNTNGTSSLSVSTSSVDSITTVLNINFTSIGGGHFIGIDFDLSDVEQYALEAHVVGYGGSLPDYFMIWPLVEQAGGTVDALAYSKFTGFSNTSAFLYNDNEFISTRGLEAIAPLTSLIDNFGGLVVRCIVNKKPDVNNNYTLKILQAFPNGSPWEVEQIISSSIGGTWNFSGSVFNRCGIGAGEHGSTVTGFFQLQDLRIVSVTSSLDVFF